MNKVASEDSLNAGKTQNPIHNNYSTNGPMQSHVTDEDKYTESQVFENPDQAAKRHKFTKFFLGGVCVVLILGVVLTVARFLGATDYNTSPFVNDDDEAPAIIYQPDAVFLKEQAVVMQARRPGMIMPPPLSPYKEKALIHISTDKPFYRPDETVFIEAFLIDSVSKKPLFARQDTIYPQMLYESYSYLNVYATAKIFDSFDKEIASLPQQKLFNGTIVFNTWKVPSSQSGGEYKV